MEANQYQRRKARAIAATFMLAAIASDTPLAKLPELAARMNDAQWRTVAFQAGQPVPDHAAKVLTVALLAKLA